MIKNLRFESCPIRGTKPEHLIEKITAPAYLSDLRICADTPTARRPARPLFRDRTERYAGRAISG